MSDVDEDPDTDVQATFLIPCSERARKIEDEKPGFPPLYPFEEDERASKIRYEAFRDSVSRVEAAFQRTFECLYAPAVLEVATILSSIGPVDQSGSPWLHKLLAVILPSSALISATFIDGIRSAFEENGKKIWVQLQPRECLDLSSTLRLLTSRSLVSRPDILESCDLTDPLSLSFLGSGTTVCILIDSVATFHYGVLNDLIQALHALSDDEGAPTYRLLLVLEHGQGTTDDKLDPATYPLLRLSPVQLATPTFYFEELMEQMFLDKDGESTSQVWISQSLTEMLVQHYYEYQADLDRIRSDIVLALHNHFSRNPMSTLCGRSSEKRSLWMHAFFSRVRQCFIARGGDNTSSISVRLPLPKAGSISAAVSKQEYLRDLLTDDQVLLASIESFRDAIAKRRASLIAGVRLAHLLRTSLGMNDVDTDDGQVCFRPRLTRIGGLLLALSDTVQQRIVIQDIRTAIRSRSLPTLKAILERVETGESLLNKQQQDTYSTIFSQVVQMASTSEEHAVQDPNNDEERFERVQRNLLREESSTQLKRQVGDWLIDLLRSLLQPPAPLETEIWTTSNDVDLLKAMLVPAPRINALIALNDPQAYFGRRAFHRPDVCLAYQTYQDAGRMVNLADWFTAFRLSIDSGNDRGDVEKPNGHPLSPPRKRGLERNSGSDSSDLSEPEKEEDAHEVKRQKANTSRREKELASWNRADMVRARFALAVHELGAMGFLKKTRRKQEHVMKLIFDLPPKME